MRWNINSPTCLEINSYENIFNTEILWEFLRWHINDKFENHQDHLVNMNAVVEIEVSFPISFSLFINNMLAIDTIYTCKVFQRFMFPCKT